MDGRHFATAKLEPGEVSRQGYVGMIRYASDYQFRGLKIVEASGRQIFPTASASTASRAQDPPQALQASHHNRPSNTKFTSAQQNACQNFCESKGFGCGRSTAAGGSNQMYSCYNACRMRTKVTQSQCQATVRAAAAKNGQGGCGPVVAGLKFDLCGPVQCGTQANSKDWKQESGLTGCSFNPAQSSASAKSPHKLWEVHVSDGNAKVIAADGTFTVNGKILGHGRWIDFPKMFVVQVPSWGNIWWVGKTKLNAAGRLSGMLTTTVHDVLQAKHASPRHFEPGFALGYWKVKGKKDSEPMLSPPPAPRAQSGDSDTNQDWNSLGYGPYVQRGLRMQRARMLLWTYSTWLLALITLLCGLVWGFFERKRRRCIAAENGGYSERTGDYQTGLFACFGYPKVCLPACLFTPCLAAFNRSEVEHRDCTACDACFSLKPQITQYHTRQSVRAAHLLEEAPVTDCLAAVCCTPCAVAQDTIELERRTVVPVVVTVADTPPAYAAVLPTAPQLVESSNGALEKKDEVKVQIQV